MDDIKRAVAKLEGDEKATAFLISEEYMLTSKHIFIPNNDFSTYTISFPNNNTEKVYTISDTYYEKDKSINELGNDIAIIKLNEPIYDIQPLELDFSEIKIDDDWQAYGFPGSKRPIGERFIGKVNDLLHNRFDKKFDVNLHCEVPQIIDSYYGVEGASGSPIIRDGKVIAVFSNQSEGAILGAASIKRSEEFLKKYVTNLKKAGLKSIVQIEIEKAISNTERFIEGFPDELHELLKRELSELEREIIADLEKFNSFLESSKYPLAEKNTRFIGLDSTLEIILMVRCIYGNVHILIKDDFANLQVKTTKSLNMNFVYAQQRNQIMPEILLEMHNGMINKSAAQILIECDKPIPPYPMIFDNCSNSKRHNLCRSCGKQFEFEGILKKYIDTEDDGLIKGIESNNFSLLNKTKIICAECVRKVRDEAESGEDLQRMVVEKIYD